MQSGFEGARCGLAKTANRGVAHRLPHLSQGVDLFGYRTERTALDQTVERLLLTNSADPAGNTLAASFMTEEGGDPEKNPLQADSVVKQHDDPGAERRADR